MITSIKGARVAREALIGLLAWRNDGAIAWDDAGGNTHVIQDEIDKIYKELADWEARQPRLTSS